MDTISRDSSSSYLPVAGVIVGFVALVLAVAALIKANSVGKRVPEDLPDQLAALKSGSETATAAAAAADKAKNDIKALQDSVQTAFNSVGQEFANLKGSIAKLEETAKARAVAPPRAGKGGEPAVAGPGEYVVKPGDNGMKIVKATGVSLSQLEAANPGIDWKHLHVGQTVKTK